MAAKTQREKEAEAKSKAQSRQQVALNNTKQTAKPYQPSTPSIKGQGVPAAAAAGAPAPAATGPAAPAAPAAVDPFFTPEDLDAINAFTTDLQTKLEGIDFDLKNAETDTTLQKTQNDSAAKQNSSGAVDDAIGRGIFQSSVKDATLFDIEAQRSLAAKFLDDKLTAQRLTAGTNKQILGTAKTNFDTNMATRKVNNATGVNDANSSAWADAMAAWSAANPVAAPAAGPAPAAPAATVTAKPKPKTTTLFAPTPTSTVKNNTTKPNTASGSGSIKPKTKTTKVQYGNTP